MRDATIDAVRRSLKQDVHINEALFADLHARRPPFADVAPLLRDARPDAVRAAVLYLGLNGTPAEAPVLATLLHHTDAEVVDLAEYGLWRIWIQGGSPPENRRLAAAISLAHAGQQEAALRALDAMLSEDPRLAEAHFQRGLVLVALGRLVEADGAYRQALKLNPHHFAAAAALGHVCVEQYNPVGALYYYRRALQIHPRLDGIVDAVRSLEQRLGHRGDA